MKRLREPLLFMTAGDLIQLMGVHFYTVAIAAHTYSMTGSAWIYAVQQLLSFLPWMLLPGIAGPLIDRMDRRKVMVVAGLLRGLLYLCYPYLRTIEPILALNFLASSCGVFLVTARTALIPSLAEKGALLKVNGLRTAAFGCIDLVVPAVAGAVMTPLGTNSAFRLVSAAMIAGAAAFAAMPLPVAAPGRRRPAGGGAGFGRDLHEATTFLKGQRALLGSIAVFTLYTAGQNGTNTLFYPFVNSVLRRGPEVFGLSVSFYFGANLLAGLLLAKYGRVMERVPMAILAIPPALIWFAYTVARSIPVILALGFIEGMMMSLLSTLFMTEVQAKAPPEMTGRVWGVASSVNGGGQVAGILLAGAIGDRSGPLAGYRVLGTLTIVLVLLAEAARRSAASREKVSGLL